MLVNDGTVPSDNKTLNRATVIPVRYGTLVGLLPIIISRRRRVNRLSTSILFERYPICFALLPTEVYDVDTTLCTAVYVVMSVRPFTCATGDADHKRVARTRRRN